MTTFLFLIRYLQAHVKSVLDMDGHCMTSGPIRIPSGERRLMIGLTA